MRKSLIRKGGTIIVSVLLAFLFCFIAFNAKTVKAETTTDTRELIMEDQLIDASKMVDKDAVYTYNVAAGTVLVEDSTFILPTYPAMSTSFTYDVSDTTKFDFPLVQLQFDMGFYYGDTETVHQAALNAISFETSTDGVTFKKTSVKLMEEPSYAPEVAGPGGWCRVRAVNFAAIRSGTKQIRITMTSPKDIWDVEASKVAFYKADAGDINLVEPTITLNDKKSYPKQRIKGGDVEILKATATDDTTASADMKIDVKVLSPVDSPVLIENNKFLLSMYGEYKIVYTAFDSHGNMTEYTCVVESVDKQDAGCGVAMFSTGSGIIGGGLLIAVLAATLALTLTFRKKAVKCR